MGTEGMDGWMDTHLVAKKRELGGGSCKGKRVSEEDEWETSASLRVKETRLFLVG